MQHTLVFTKTSLNVSKCGCIPTQEISEGVLIIIRVFCAISLYKHLVCLHSSAFCHKPVCAYNRNLLLHVFEIIQYKALSTCKCMLDKEYIKE